MKAAIACLPLILLVQGCVGFAVNKTRTETFREPILTETGHYMYERISSPSDLNEIEARCQCDTSWMTNAVIYTSSWLQEHWGKPASITHSGTDGLDEIWAYEFDAIWEGVEPFIVVPIPIELPVRREMVRFVLRDGRVISASRIDPYRVGGVAGFIISPDRPYFGAFSLTDSK